VAPYDNNARSKIYEIGQDGVATEHRDVAGSASTFVRVR